MTPNQAIIDFADLLNIHGSGGILVNDMDSTRGMKRLGMLS
jgi:hypothetical protein